MSQNEEYRERLNKVHRNKTTYELTIIHNAIRVELEWTSPISELTKIEADIVEQILTERGIWFPKLDY